MDTYSLGKDFTDDMDDDSFDVDAKVEGYMKYWNAAGDITEDEPKEED